MEEEMFKIILNEIDTVSFNSDLIDDEEMWDLIIEEGNYEMENCRRINE